MTPPSDRERAQELYLIFKDYPNPEGLIEGELFLIEKCVEFLAAVREEERERCQQVTFDLIAKYYQLDEAKLREQFAAIRAQGDENER